MTALATASAPGDVHHAPKRRRADAQRNIDRILAAADSVVERDGADAAIDEIVRVAGVGSATLYRHFPTRMALMEAVFRVRMEEVCAEAQVLAERAPAGEALNIWLHAIVEHLMAAQGMLSALVLRGLQQTDADANLMWGLTMLADAADDLVAEARGAGQIRSDITTQDIVDLLYGICLAIDRRRGTTPSPEASAIHLLELTLSGIVVQQPAPIS